MSRRTRPRGTGRLGAPGWPRSGRAIEAALDAALPAESEKPRACTARCATRSSPGGKRIRPALGALGFRLGGGRGDGGARLGAAIELIHTFSLIHDDLPCMDDDDYRRGRLTCHRKFGEAVAVLAGDGLQVLAFEVLATLPASAERRLRVLHEITRAVGHAGVIGGQVVDIESEGRRISPASLRWMHERKTGALLRASLVSGAILAGARARAGGEARARSARRSGSSSRSPTICLTSTGATARWGGGADATAFAARRPTRRSWGGKKAARGSGRGGGGGPLLDPGEGRGGRDLRRPGGHGGGAASRRQS